MSKKKQPASTPPPDGLFDRVATILEQARGNVVRAVNTNMVYAYWWIGREIVEELQGGEERAAYGKEVVKILSARLTARFGRGYSPQVLWSFRQFHLAYSSRIQILFPPGRESPKLCSDKGEAVAKYSILNESRQIFASKYLPNLPTEEQLRMEIEKERSLIEMNMEDQADA